MFGFSIEWNDYARTDTFKYTTLYKFREKLTHPVTFCERIIKFYVQTPLL